MSGRQRLMLGRVPVAMTATTLALVLVLTLWAITALAQTTGGYLTGGDLGVGVGLAGGSGGGSGGGGSGSGSGSGGSVPVCTTQGATGPVSYRALSEAEAAPLNAAGPRVDELNPGHSILVGKSEPAPTLNNPNPPPVEGTWYAKSCGNIQAGYVWAPAGTSPGPPPPPPPPTAAEMFDHIPIPAPAFGVSPRGDGLTGLATWLWDPSGTSGRTVTATIRGWTATATANPGSWQWTMADPGEPGPASTKNPSPTVSASSPGSEASPAVTYTYETPGVYTLTLRVTWSGSFTYTRPGFTSATAPLGTSTRTTTRSYTVASISPVLVSG